MHYFTGDQLAQQHATWGSDTTFLSNNTRKIWNSFWRVWLCIYALSTLKKTSCFYWSAMPSIILWCLGRGAAFKTTCHQCHCLLYICWHAEASAIIVNHLFDTEELRVNAEKWDGREGSVLCYKSEQWCMTRTQSTNSCSQALFSPDLSHFSPAILTTPNLWLSECTAEIYVLGWRENLTVQISGVTSPWAARTLNN